MKCTLPIINSTPTASRDMPLKKHTNRATMCSKPRTPNQPKKNRKNARPRGATTLRTRPKFTGIYLVQESITTLLLIGAARARLQAKKSPSKGS